MKTKSGFTLIELIIVIAIVGILAAVGYPGYVEHVKKAQCADGINALLQLSGRMEELYMNTDSYATATVGTPAGTVGSDVTPEGYYGLSITTATAFDYLVTATPVDGQQKTLTLDSLGRKAESGGAAGAGAASCW